MSVARAHKGDIGRQFKLDAGEDISTATVVQIKYKKPDDTTGTWTAAVVDNNYGAYTTSLITDLDQTGKWWIQLYVEMGGARIHGAVASFHVYKRLTD